jgi:transposase
MEGCMNKFAPKSVFLKQRAISLHKSGLNANEISRMLQISKDTAYCWLSDEYKKRTVVQRALAKAEKEAVKREPVSVLPTLPYVPHIVPTQPAKYQMAAPA